MVAYYSVSGQAAKNILLLLASLVFYMWGEPMRIVLMVVFVVFNWIFGAAIEKSSIRKKVYLVLDLLLDLAAMGCSSTKRSSSGTPMCFWMWDCRRISLP